MRCVFNRDHTVLQCRFTEVPARDGLFGGVPLSLAYRQLYPLNQALDSWRQKYIAWFQEYLFLFYCRMVYVSQLVIEQHLMHSAIRFQAEPTVPKHAGGTKLYVRHHQTCSHITGSFCNTECLDVRHCGRVGSHNSNQYTPCCCPDGIATECFGLHRFEASFWGYSTPLVCRAWTLEPRAS